MPENIDTIVDAIVEALKIMGSASGGGNFDMTSLASQTNWDTNLVQIALED